MEQNDDHKNGDLINAHGELVGVNYDRTYEATINDYAWNENYSCSTGVDIRYVLWVIQKKKEKRILYLTNWE